jgi:hypothetical protein
MFMNTLLDVLNRGITFYNFFLSPSACLPSGVHKKLFISKIDNVVNLCVIRCGVIFYNLILIASLYELKLFHHEKGM